MTSKEPVGGRKTAGGDVCSEAADGPEGDRLETPRSSSSPAETDSADDAIVLPLRGPVKAAETAGLSEERRREMRRWIEEHRSDMPSSVRELAHRILESGDIDG